MRKPIGWSWVMGLGLASVLWMSSQACTSDDGDTNEDSGQASGEATAGNCEPQPEGGVLYASCTGGDMCDDGLICAYNQELGATASPAYCTGYCTFSEQCEVVGLCTAEPMCITPSNGNTGVCVLDCSDGKQCPEGMECLEDVDGGAIRHLCY